ncbi:unnamed protein product [Moneuplotes crassus]|uniref:Uncharacterized protein n=1 Tax=Euplotes crassus TaxID=5936 RepID=A0AAD1XY26_EUPCR|nr:unnamed protein product [Moneuplotes crassus]
MDKSMIYKQHIPLDQFNEKISGFNCTIPTLWMANRLKSANSSLFLLSDEDLSDRSGRNIHHGKILSKICEKTRKKGIKRRTINNKSREQPRLSSNINITNEGSFMSNINLKSIKNIHQPPEKILKSRKFSFRKLDDQPTPIDPKHPPPLQNILFEDKEIPIKIRTSKNFISIKNLTQEMTQNLSQKPHRQTTALPKHRNNIHKRFEIFRHMLARSQSSHSTYNKIWIPRTELRKHPRVPHLMSNPRLDLNIEEENKESLVKGKNIVLEDKIEMIFRQAYGTQTEESQEEVKEGVEENIEISADGVRESNYGEMERGNIRKHDKDIKIKNTIKTHSNKEVLINKNSRLIKKLTKEIPMSPSSNIYSKRTSQIVSRRNSKEQNLDIQAVKNPITPPSDVIPPQAQSQPEPDIVTQDQSKSMIKTFVANVPVKDITFEREPTEKPTFFETSVDVPSHLKTSALYIKRGRDPDGPKGEPKGDCNQENLGLNTRFNKQLTADLKNFNMNPMGRKEVYQIGEHLDEYDTDSSKEIPRDSNASAPSYMKITGKGNYYNYKEFMSDYFDHRELIAMKPFDRIERIKQTREYYKPKRFN